MTWLMLADWLKADNSGDPAAFVEELTRRPAWMSRAQCRGEDRATFFPAAVRCGDDWAISVKRLERWLGEGD